MAAEQVPIIVEKQLGGPPGRSDSMRPKVTPDDVTRFFNVRTALWTANSPTQLQAICTQFGIPAPEITQQTVVEKGLRKDLFNRYAQEYFPQSESIEAHNAKLHTRLNSVVQHLAFGQSDAVLYTVGSFAKGKINGTQSDLDFVMVLPEMTDTDAQQREIDLITQLQDKGIIFSQELGPFEDLRQILSTGRGLARMYAMTEDGLEVEFHVLGIHDMQDMPRPQPGFIRRVREVPAKFEQGHSFTGRRDKIFKPSDRVYNYVQQNGETFVSFYPSLLVWGSPIYDPSGDGKRMLDGLMQAYVKAFIYHNDGYQTINGERVIDFSKIPFDRFLATLYYHQREDYAPANLSELERRYVATVGQVARRVQATIQ
ncbi:MAG TPA: nucleotidyltransferase domain-containing protein [Patescibacteria group bacterium]|nr:nucleotidyltransferase domain-containing protein [Patescibacteria group bacterium]